MDQDDLVEQIVHVLEHRMLHPLGVLPDDALTNLHLLPGAGTSQGADVPVSDAGPVGRSRRRRPREAGRTRA